MKTFIRSAAGLLAALTMWFGTAAAVQIPTTAANAWTTVTTPTTYYVKTTPSGLQMRVALSGATAVGALTDTTLLTQNNTTSPLLPATTNGIQATTTVAGCQTSAPTSLTCGGLGTVTISFTDSAGNPVKVRNPVLHFSRFGGNATNTGVAVYFSTTYTLTTPGVTLGAPAAGSQNLSVSAGTVRAATLGASITGLCSATAGANTAGCGSVPVTGTTSQLTFDVGAARHSTATTANWNIGPTAVDGVFITVSFDEDFGDAPASYDPTAAASHLLGELTLGSSVDAENATVFNGGATNATSVTPSPTAVAAGADNTGTNGDGADEDAITTFPVLPITATSYALTVPISGASAAGQVCGWIDFNRGGTFGDVGSERACAAFASGATSVELNWSGLSGLSTGTNYVRLRASYDTAGVQNPTGRLHSGEVEDYRLTITPAADLSVTKTDGVSSVNAGGTTTYTVRVTNTGPSSVTGATLTDAAVSGLNVTAVSCSGTPGQCTAGTTPTVAQLQAGYALPALASGQFYELTVTGTITATSGSVANTATIAAPSGTTDPSTGNNSATDTDTVTPVADLTLTKTNAVTSVNAGGTTTYTVTLTNNGPSSAGGTVLTDPVASGLNKTSVSCSAAGGAACPAITTSTLETGVTIATLPAGASITLTIAASVTATSGGVTNSVTAALPGGTTDLTPTGTVSDTDTVTPVADLSVTKTDSVATFRPGDTLTYTVVIRNAGPSAAVGATVSDPLPSGIPAANMSYTAAVSAGATTAVSGTQSGALSDTVTIPVGGTVTYTVTVTVPLTSAGTTVVNTATVTPPAGTTDPVGGDNSATDTDTRVPPTATADTASTNPLTPVTFSVTDNDTGPVDPATVDLDPATPGQQTTFTDPGKGDYSVDASGNVTFTPAPGFVLGTSTVSYTVLDAAGLSTAPASIGVSVPVATDIAVTKTGPAYVRPGEALTYTITVTNTTAAPAGAYTVTDTLAAGLSFVAASDGGTYDSGTRTVTWALAALAGSAQQSLTLSVTAPSEAQVLGGTTAVQNAASATLTGDPNGANNTSATVTTRMILTQLVKSVRNIDEPTSVFGTSGGGKPGQVLEYCLEARNLGGADLGTALSGYRVRDTLSTNVEGLLTGYDADEPSAATGYGVRVTRGAAAPTYLKSDVATLSATTLDVNLGILAAGETVTTCFQATIR